MSEVWWYVDDVDRVELDAVDVHEQISVARLNRRQLRAVQIAHLRGRVRNQDVRAACGEVVCGETVRKDLRALVAAGVLERRGQKKGTFYVLAGET
jgi:predicted HTH transcriptional regulator